MARTDNVLLAVAAAHGIALAVMVTATMRISGHLNPAVTLGFLAARRIEPMMAMLYIVAQLLGATVAAYVLKSTFPAERRDGRASRWAVARAGRLVRHGDRARGDRDVLPRVRRVRHRSRSARAQGRRVRDRAHRHGGHPRHRTAHRSLDEPGALVRPAIASGIFEAQAVYWIGPIVGGIAAALLYDTLFLRRGREPVDHGAVSPKD
jgi:hypothetical protein